MKESNYSNPELRPFAAFFSDLTPEQLEKHNTTRRMLDTLAETAEDPVAWTFVKILSYALEGKLCPVKRTNDCPVEIAAYYNVETGNWVALEWNKVRGVCEKEYRHVAFLKKIFTNYDVAEADIYASEETFAFAALAPHIPKLFPKIKEFSIKVLDNPSEMYVYSNIRSCMVDTEYVKFYDTAPCQGLLVEYKGKPVARTLLWTLQDGRKMLDRVYDTSGHGEVLLRAYAQEHGYLLDTPANAHVVAPVSPYGIPYLDSLGVGIIRIDNTIHLFGSHGCFKAFKQECEKNNENIIGTADGYCQNGNIRAMRMNLVEYNGGWVDPETLVVIDGKTLCTYDYPTASVEGVIPGVTDNDLFAYRQGSRDILVYGRDLIVVDNCICHKLEVIVTPDGSTMLAQAVSFKLHINEAGELAFHSLLNFNNRDYSWMRSRCITCFNHTSESHEFIMGLLPTEILEQFNMDRDALINYVMGNLRMDAAEYREFARNIHKYVPAGRSSL